MTPLSDVVPWLICPICDSALDHLGKRLVCSDGHSFDVARQGYVNLSNSRPPANADTSEMVSARERFLELGHYLPIAQALTAASSPSQRVVEVGAGTGYYLSAILNAWPGSLGLACDISVTACRRAARAHHRMAAAVADTWRKLPLGDGSVDTMTCVFAPRNPQEFFRILAPGGQVVVVFPNQEHLASLRDSHGLLKVHPSKADELISSFHAFDLVSAQRLSYDIDLDASAVSDLIAMGPNAFHQHRIEPLAARTTVSVELMVFARP